jgi:hypothetical protein
MPVFVFLPLGALAAHCMMALARGLLKGIAVSFLAVGTGFEPAIFTLTG